MWLQVWNVHSVLNVLHSFVDKSNIDQQLEVFNATGGMLTSPFLLLSVTDSYCDVLLAVNVVIVIRTNFLSLVS